MRIVHISKIAEAIHEHKHVIFIIRSHECGEKLLQALEDEGCTWAMGNKPTKYGVNYLDIPGGVRAEEKRIKKGSLDNYESGYLPYVPRLRVVL